jgi:hypothetical protein
MLPRPLMIALTLLIAAVWAGNVVIGFIDPSRHDPSINAVFALAVGAVFAVGKREDGLKDARRRLGRLIAGDQDEPDEPAEAYGPERHPHRRSSDPPTRNHSQHPPEHPPGDRPGARPGQETADDVGER